MTKNDIVRELLVEGIDDWVLVDTVVALAREGSAAPAESYTSLTTEILWSLMEQGLIQVGEIGESGFEAWSGGAGEVLDRAVSVLDGCDWKPMGGAFWIANTPLGDVKAATWA